MNSETEKRTARQTRQERNCNMLKVLLASEGTEIYFRPISYVVNAFPQQRDTMSGKYCHVYS
jgi:hypothetical protein